MSNLELARRLAFILAAGDHEMSQLEAEHTAIGRMLASAGAKVEDETAQLKRKKSCGNRSRV